MRDRGAHLGGKWKGAHWRDIEKVGGGHTRMVCGGTLEGWMRREGTLEW